MHNLYANQVRAQRSRPMHQPIDGLGAEPRVGEAQTMHVALSEMAQALGQLPEEQRRVVLLVALEGLSYQEVAAVMDVPVGTVMSRLSRGRDRLRRLAGGEAGPLLRRIK
jgi:RNA polymerase sigma-70 factor (ECF subfamily)